MYSRTDVNPLPLRRGYAPTFETQRIQPPKRHTYNSAIADFWTKANLEKALRGSDIWHSVHHRSAGSPGADEEPWEERGGCASGMTSR